MGKWIYGFLCALVLLSSTHKNIENDIIGVWMGGGYQLDENYYRPISSLFYFENRSVLAIKKIGETTDTLVYSFNGSELSINNRKTSSFELNDDNVLSYKGGQARFFFKKIFPSTQDLSGKDISRLLAAKYWKRENEILYFDTETQQLKVYEHGNEKHSSYCFEIDVFEDMYLLSKYGNLANCKANRQFLEQILSISESQLEVLRWENNSFKKAKYIAIEKTTSLLDEALGFQLCDQYLNPNYPVHRYYTTAANYKGGIYTINKIVESKYKRPKSKENGLIRIRFVVNCEGKTGLFDVLELDSNYKEKKFDQAISSQILEITKTLDDWVVGSINEQAVDSYKFLTFKIKDSDVVEIFP